MIVIPPIQVTDSNLVSSNVPEPGTGEVVWNAANNYTQGQVVIRTTTHRKYENVIPGVDSGLPENTPTRWLDVGPTNKWAMFDQNRNMATTNPGSMTVTISPGKRINSIGLLGVQANSVTITMKVGSTIIYGPVTRNMNGRLTTTWSEYFFGEFAYVPTLLLLDLPPAANATVTVQFDNPSNTVACSGIILGSKVYLGKIQYNAKSDSLNFSKIERDEFGNSLLIRRRTIPKTSQSLWVEKTNVNNVRKVRETLNAVPALWSGLDDNTDDDYSEALLIFGIYKQFEIDIGYPSVATVNLELEEL